MGDSRPSSSHWQPLGLRLCPICPTQRLQISFSFPIGIGRVSVYYLQSLFWVRSLRGHRATVRKNSRLVTNPLALLLSLGLLVGLSACGGGSSTGTVTAVTITPPTISVQVNAQTEYTATVSVAGQTSTNTSATSTAVTWYVNNVAGGDISTTGSIQNDPNDPQAGIYTAPAKVPTTTTAGQSGVVSITATAQRNPNGGAAGGANTLVTSNASLLTVTPGLGLQIISPPSTVPAGGSAQFNATLNGVAPTQQQPAIWSISSTTPGNIGSIDPNSGIYTAPTTPPPGDVVTITVSDSGVTATTSINIVYSDLALNGAYAFSYTGNDSQGFLAAAGSFNADGQGHIRSGIEDVSSFLFGVFSQVEINATSSYNVGPDGRGKLSLNTARGTQTIAFVLSTNAHGIITRFDSDPAATGSGSMDVQHINPLLLSGTYVFTALGTDKTFNPEGIAGEFTANGGAISATPSLIDIHDGASSSATITTDGTLSSNSTYAFDAENLGTGRGTLTLNTSVGALEFAFYVVDSTQMYLVEIDQTNAYLAGQAFTADTGLGLAGSNYVFTAGGMAPASAAPNAPGPYAAGGVFVSSGAGAVSSGTFDANNQGKPTSTALVSCPYTIDPSSGRVDLRLFVGTGNCPTTSATSLSEFAAYPYTTDQSGQPANGYLLLEIDPNALSTGAAFPQSFSSALPAGGFALGLAGQGVTKGAPSASAQDVDGELSDLAGSLGELDVNYFQPSPNNAVTSFALSAPSTTGRGTLTIASSRVTYSLIYYLINSTEAILLDQDQNPASVQIGTLQRQF